VIGVVVEKRERCELNSTHARQHSSRAEMTKAQQQQQTEREMTKRRPIIFINDQQQQ
jgi:hypothetical protein